jgi:hypothetical protein
MNKYNVLIGLILTFGYLLSAEAYRPKFPKSPYYFSSENQKFLVEVTPTILQSSDAKHLLVKKSQSLIIYKKSENNSWKEESSFRVGKMPLIKEVLISNTGKFLVIRIDESPMVRNINKDDGIFIYSAAGKKLKSYSHLSVFSRPGIFRNMKIEMNNKQNELVITDEKKVIKLALPSE